jgi:nucleosome binding factor SPN SPT16 subunit
VLPINGASVPFHVSTIKGVSKKFENYLRIMFVSPSTGIRNSLTERVPVFVDNPDKAFVKEVCYRIDDPKLLGSHLKEIKFLQVRAVSFLARRPLSSHTRTRRKTSLIA